MTFSMRDLNMESLNQAAIRKLTPHDNLKVVNLDPFSTGTFPRMIELRLPGDDGAIQTALWDGSLDLAVDDFVVADEYAGQTVWRISSMGGGDSGAGKQRVSKVWESDFENVILSIDDDGLITMQPATDSTTFLQVLDADGGTSILNVDSTNEFVGVGTDSPDLKLHVVTDSVGIGAAPIWNTSRDVAVFEGKSGENTVLNILTNNNKVGKLGFSDNNARGIGGVSYDHNSDSMTINTNNSVRITIDSNGDAGVGWTTTNLRTSIAGSGTNTTPLLVGHFLPTSVSAKPEVTLGLINENASGVYVGMSFQVRSSSSPGAVMYLERTANFQGDLIFQIRSGSGTVPEVMRMRHTGDVGIGESSPNSILHIGGPIATAQSTKTTNYTLTATDSEIFGDATSGDITMTLPAVATIPGRRYTIHKIDASSNKVIIDGSGAETINGATTLDIIFQYDSLQIVTDGSEWFAR
jgi:hypothetical protein